MKGNKIVKHSSCYTGPAGDSRPATEIFDGMEKRAEQSMRAIGKLRKCLDDTLAAMTLSSQDGAVNSIKDTFIDWWVKHDLSVKERIECSQVMISCEMTNEKAIVSCGKCNKELSGCERFCPECGCKITYGQPSEEFKSIIADL